MDFKRVSRASYLIYHCQPIGRLKRHRNFEALEQITECLYRMRDAIDEEVTKQLMWGKAPTLKCKKWLEKVAEIEDQVNDILKTQDKTDDLFMHSKIDLISMHNKITDHLKKSPSAHGSMAHVSHGKTKTITSPILHGEAYGLVEENKDVNLQRRPEFETKGTEAKAEMEMSPTQGKGAVQGNEMRQGIYVKSKAMQGSTLAGASSKFIDQSDGHLARETINQTEGDEALLESGVNTSKSIQLKLCEILGCMNDVAISRIAIHGIGGIGKTTLLKALATLVERKRMFDKIISVTVSRDCSTRKIQNEVLRQLDMCEPDSETDSKLAEKLFRVLNSKKYLVLLDDVWEPINLKSVGIPDHLSSGNGCKMILATRKLDVCNAVVADRVIKMETVSREEAWELFCKQVDPEVREVVDSLDVQHCARGIVGECRGLPLLVIVTGRALRKENNAQEWNRALRKLLLPGALGIYGVGAVMHHLKFSYDRLKARDAKSFFLYCALLSEDQEVSINDLVKYCTQEGIISGNWDDACKRAHAIRDILVGASLLQSTEDGLAIRMHDLVRDFASTIILSKAERLQFLLRQMGTSQDEREMGTNQNEIEMGTSQDESLIRDTLLIHEDCQFFSRGGGGLREPLIKERWEQAKMIALMDNEISSLPENPCCHNLLMLFLQRNRRLRVIPTSFFDGMPSLEVLNLSNTRIKFLPQSICNLKRLKVLSLRNCERLVVLPSEIGSLGDLEVLDLQGTEVDKLPNEIGRLASLRHLDVSFYGSISPNEYAKLPDELLSHGIISKLLSLETLSIDVYPGDQRWKKSVESITKEVCSLKKLTALCFHFPEVELLKFFLRGCPRWNNKLLTRFKFVVGYDVKRIVSRIPNSVVLDYNKHGQCLRFVNGNTVPDAVVEVLTRTVAFYLDHHLSVRSLSEFGVSNIGKLELCIVSECTQIKSIIDDTDPSIPAFPSLEHLSVHYLPNLNNIWEGIRPIPSGSFAKLRILLVYACPKLKYVLTTTMLSCVSKLEELVVEDCPVIEVITLQDGIMDSRIVSFLNLKRLTLNHLPRLINIWEGAWPSMEDINLYNCPNSKIIIGANSKVKVNYIED